jgi:peptidoglycan biosynthesis protein MviN/MurJ (putative lipid II flippase)
MLIRASSIALITIIGMGGQFLIRAVLTAHLGPGEQLDVFFLTLGWAGALASAIFQAVAMVLAPQTVGADVSPTIRGLARRTAQILTVVTTVLAVLTALSVAAIGHFSASPVVLFVLLGWGVAGGLAFFQRQLLLAWGEPFAPAILALIPAVVILTLAWCNVIESTLGFALVGCLAWSFVAGLGGILLWRSWRQRGVPQASASPPGAIGRLLRLAAPVFGANWNSQANQRSQDALAAFSNTAGGVTLFGNALALARLPQTIADSIFSSTAYTRILHAIASSNTTALRSAYRLALRVHLAITVPVAAAVIVAGDAATQAVFAHGNCSVEDTRIIASVLWWTAPGIVISSLQSVHSQILLAHGRTAAVLRVELAFTVLSIALAALVLPYLGLPGITIAGTIAFVLIQVPMIRLIASTGLHWEDTVSELLRACLPVLPACLIAVWAGDFCGPSAWVRSLMVGGIILAVSLPCSAWAIVRAQRHDR